VRALAATVLLLAAALAIAIAFGACAGASDEPALPELPPHFPPLPLPADDPPTADRVALGRRLFYDPRLSAAGDVSCATCHQQALAFTDGRARALGSGGHEHRRSSPSLANVAYARRLTWANPLLDRLEHQALVPLFGEEPVEMGSAGREDELRARLRALPEYVAAFAAAYPEDADPITVRNILRALASFERTLVSADSAYDRWLAGDPDALDATARRGLALFESERVGCARCHGGVLFDAPTPAPALLMGATAGEPAALGYHHTGLYDEDGAGGYPATDRGLVEVTGDPDDEGRFRAPTLRNVAATAPYMHDGSIATLDAVIDHYAAGGRARSPRVSERLRPFRLTDTERAELLAFLEALTDHAFLTDPALSSPFAHAP
jgi:cytochrome c peroxidase